MAHRMATKWPGTANLLSISRAALTPCDARESWPATQVAGHFTLAVQADIELRKLRGVIAVSLRKAFEKWL